MRFAIMESVVTPGGHEIDFDRLLVEELTALGHRVEFYVPEGHEFKWDYGAPVHRLRGEGVSYRGARGLKKLLLALRREMHRRGWYRDLAGAAEAGAFDALIFPSATYRYLRGLQHSRLKHSPVPVLFLIHGATPAEAEKLDREAGKLVAFPNIRIGLQTFAGGKLHLSAPHLRVYGPPNYLPRDIDPEAVRSGREPLAFAPAAGTETFRPLPPGDEIRLGFFGQYRREKNLDTLLRAFAGGRYERRVHLIVQGSTQRPEDATDFSRLRGEWSSWRDERGQASLEFWPRPLIGPDWQRALASCDALVVPYGNPRYLYHTSALISNALGYRKSLLAADDVNPEVLAEYGVGLSFPAGDAGALRAALEEFVNTYGERQGEYEKGLARAYEDFSPRRLAENVVSLAEGRYD